MSADPRQFCTQYMEQIFTQWDKDNSGVLDRQELKNWLNAQMKAKPLRKKQVKEGFNDLIKGSDTNKDGKVDRWEFFHHCLRNYNPE